MLENNYNDRNPAYLAKHIPQTLEEWEGLRNLTAKELFEKGLKLWDETGLMLFPHTWYYFIPEGFKMVNINDEEFDDFKIGETDADHRYGALAYGIRVELTDDEQEEAEATTQEKMSNKIVMDHDAHIIIAKGTNDD